MLNIENAPQKGILYATYIDKMVFQKYQSLEEISEFLTEEKMLELHLFDSKKELRFVKTSKAAEKGILRCEISEQDKYDDFYCESLYYNDDNVDKHDELTRKVEVVNYIRYDMNDMIEIVNYRLKEVE